MSAYDSFDFTHEGLTFRASLHYDSDMGAPWEEHDGHGPVSGWTSNAKRSNERLLDREAFGQVKRYYDFAGATALAKRDGWGLAPDSLTALTARLGRAPTAGEITQQAVENDFARLKAWCDDDWHWCGVVVVALDDDGEELPEEASLWGIESDSPDYHREVAIDLAEEIIRRIGEQAAVLNTAPADVARAAAGVA